MNKVLLPVAGLAVLVGSYIAYPYYAVNRLSDAVRLDDQAQLEVLVDWPSVRDGLKADLNLLLAGAIAQPTTRSNPSQALSQAVIEMLGPKVVENIAEAYATPAGLADLIRSGGELDVKGAASRTAAAMSGIPNAPALSHVPSVDQTDMQSDDRAISVKSSRFVGPGTMEVEFDSPLHAERQPMKGIMKLSGMRWKITRLLLPVDEMLDAPQTANRPQ